MKSSWKKSATKWLVSGATAFIVTIALTGCSESAEESPELEKTTDASMTETTDYVPASADGPAQNVPTPHLPAVAAEDSEDGAEAALEYFWEAEVFASMTGNSDPLVAVSDDDCAFCYESIEGWPQNYQEGYWSVIHGDIQVEVIKVDRSSDPERSGSLAHVYFQMTEPPTDYYDAEGKHLAASFETAETKDWFAVLNYDATAQMWKIEWLGLEDDINWEE